MTHSLYIGVDGGATKCIVRVEDEKGQLLGRETSGPANIRLSVTQAFDSVHSALNRILARLDIRPNDPAYRLHAGMGLAGCEVLSAYQAFLALPHRFDTLVLASDAHAACLGAHGGKDGAIIIIGTGAVGFRVEDKRVTKVSGWGFPHDDEGGGAFLGLQAVRHTLQVLDGRLAPSLLSGRLFARFEGNMETFVEWMNQANSTAFAELAPLVIESGKAGDTAAQDLMQQAGSAIDRIASALYVAHPDAAKPIALVGGLAPFVEPYLSQSLRTRLLPCKLTPDAGAIFLVRHNLAGGGL